MGVRLLDFLRRRREWFEPLREPFLVLWWVPAGYIPPVEEAIAKLEHLRRIGSSEAAFTFREPFDPPRNSTTSGLTTVPF